MQEIRCNEIFKRTVVFQSPAEVNWLKKGNQRVTSSLCAAPLALNFLIDLLNNLLIYSRKQRVVLSFFCPAGGQDVQTLSFAWHIHLAGLGREPQRHEKPQVKSKQRSLHGHARWNTSQIFFQELWCRGHGGHREVSRSFLFSVGLCTAQSQGALGGITKITTTSQLHKATNAVIGRNLIFLCHKVNDIL